jgi:mono/diheme cytochrome c family protein
MWNESRLKPMEISPTLDRSSSARWPVMHTVARGELSKSDPLRTGRQAGKLVSQSPVKVTHALLERGQERFNAYCAPCHSRLGDGNGMIARRGFPHPPDYAIVRLRKAPIGHFFDVMTNGYGVMYSQAERVSPTDRWAIASYIRVLQESRPVVTQDPYKADRERARERGILDPARGLRLEGPGGPEAGAESASTPSHQAAQNPEGSGAEAPKAGDAASPHAPAEKSGGEAKAPTGSEAPQPH